MASLQCSGALEGLKILELSDLARYKSALEAGRQVGWGYYFPYLMSRNRGRGAMLLGEDEGSVCIYLWRLRDGKAQLDLYLAPAPMNMAVLCRCLERANDFNRDLSARIFRIDAKEVEAAASTNRLRVEQRKLQYLYGPKRYSDLSGSKHYTIRRNVSLVQRLANVEVLPYSSADAKACRELLRRWSQRHRQTHGTEGGAVTSRRAIDLADVFSDTDMRGEVIYIDGRLAAFAFAGEIRPGVACIFETKSDIDVRGLAFYQRFRLLSMLRDFELVNDGSDAGRAGLRQLKDSFRPVEMHAEYRGYQRVAAQTVTWGQRIREVAKEMSVAPAS